jgi:hypothetical protein
MLEGLIGRLALVDETTEKMGKVDVEWVSKCPRFVPKNYGLLFGKRSTRPDIVAIRDEDQTARYEFI